MDEMKIQIVMLMICSFLAGIVAAIFGLTLFTPDPNMAMLRGFCQANGYDRVEAYEEGEEYARVLCRDDEGFEWFKYQIENK